MGCVRARTHVSRLCFALASQLMSSCLRSWVCAAPPEFLEGNVLGLGTANFSVTLNAYPRMLVTFFAPWCSHSAALAPEFAAAADTWSYWRMRTVCGPNRIPENV